MTYIGGRSEQPGPGSENDILSEDPEPSVKTDTFLKFSAA